MTRSALAERAGVVFSFPVVSGLERSFFLVFVWCFGGFL